MTDNNISNGSDYTIKVDHPHHDYYTLTPGGINALQRQYTGFTFTKTGPFGNGLVGTKTFGVSVGGEDKKYEFKIGPTFTWELNDVKLIEPTLEISGTVQLQATA